VKNSPVKNSRVLYNRFEDEMDFTPNQSDLLKNDLNDTRPSKSQVLSNA